MQPWHFIAFAFSIAVCLRTFSSTRSSLQVAQTTYTVFFHTKTFLQHPNPPHPPCCRQVCLEGWCDSGRSCSSHYGRLTRSHFSQSENVRSAAAVYLERGNSIIASNKQIVPPQNYSPAALRSPKGQLAGGTSGILPPSHLSNNRYRMVFLLSPRSFGQDLANIVMHYQTNSISQTFSTYTANETRRVKFLTKCW